MRSPGASLRVVEETEALLVERLKLGEERSFSELYRRYSRYVAAIGYRLLGDDLELDDLVQDAFLEVASSIHRLVFTNEALRYSARSVAQIAAHPELCAICAYEKGDSMPLLEAPARRLGLFVRTESLKNLTPAGWSLFDAGVVWAVGL